MRLTATHVLTDYPGDSDVTLITIAIGKGLFRKTWSDLSFQMITLATDKE